MQLSEAITGDGTAIFRHACWMDLEGIVFKADRLAVSQRSDTGMVEDEEPRFRAAMNEFVATVTEAVNLASLVRHVVALFEEARQGLESLAYPIDVAISASPSQLSSKSAILYRGLDRAQTHQELSGRPAYARAERWSRYRRRECGGMPPSPTTPSETQSASAKNVQIQFRI